MSIKAGEIYWDMTVNPEGVSEGMNKGVASVNAGTKTIAERLRASQLEARKSGELELQNALRSPEGLAEGLSRLIGFGMEALVASMVGNVVKELGSKAAEIREQFVKASSEGGGGIKDEMRNTVNEMAKGIPILGDFVEGFEGVREAITGERLEIKLLNEEALLTTKYFQDQYESAMQLRDALDGIRNSTERINASADSASEENPLKKRILEIRDSAKAQDEADKLDRQKQLQAEADRKEKLIEDRQLYVNNLKQQFANTYKVSFAEAKANGNGRLRNPGSLETEADLREKASDFDQIKAAQNQLDHIRGDTVNEKKINDAFDQKGAANKNNADAQEKAAIRDDQIETAAIRDRAREQELRNQKRFAEAEIKAVHDEYDEKIRVAGQGERAIQLTRERDAELDQIRIRTQQSESDAKAEAIQREYELENRMLDAQLHAVETNYKKRINEARSSAEAIYLIWAEQAEKEKIKRDASRSADRAEEELKAKELEYQGRKRDAEVIRIQSSYEDRIMHAPTDRERIALEKMDRLDIQHANEPKANFEGLKDVWMSLQRTAFGAQGAGGSNADAVANKTARATGSIDEKTSKVIDTLVQILEVVSSGGAVVGVAGP